jgi:DHA2 family multidrug resistance protein
LNGPVHLHSDLVLAAALLLCGLTSFVVFVAYQLRAREPLMNMKLFRYRQFCMGALVAFIYGAGLFGSTYLLPVYMQMALAYAPSEAGMILLPAGIFLGFTIMLAGKMADRIAPNILVSAGLSLLALSFALMAIGSAGTGYFMLMAWAIIGRVGLGFILPALSLGSMRGVDSSLIAQGSSTINFLRQLGGAIGVSLVGIVLEWRLAVHNAALSGQANAGERIHAFNETFLFVALICATAVLAAWRMRPVTAEAAAR